MKTKLNGILTLFLALVVQFAIAQTVTGKVTDATGEAVLGATVLVKGSSNATTTDFDGNYSINATSGQVLVYSFAGYTPQEITVGNNNVINVVMEESLDVVIVTAYGTTTKPKLQSAISTVSSEDLQNVPIASFEQILQGRAPGLLINSGSGQPGTAAKVRIRGTVSINGANDPLYIVDGVQIDGGAFASLNANDFENVSILKDAQATALYGSRGAAGVIVITTKRGKLNSPTRFSYSPQFGFSEVSDLKIDMLDATGYLELGRILGNNNFTDEQIAAEVAANGMDWSEPFYRTGTTLTQNMSMSGGSEKTSFFASVGYYEQEGVILTSDLQRFTTRLNLDHQANDNLKIGLGTTIGFSKRNFVPQEGAVNLRNPAIYAYLGNPLQRLRDDNGNLLTGTGNNAANYYELLTTGIQRQEEVKMQIQGNLAYELNDNWGIDYRLGLDFEDDFSQGGSAPDSFIGGTETPGGAGFYREDTNRDLFLTSTASLRYGKTFNEKHTVTGSIGTEYVKNFFRSQGFTGYGLEPSLFGFAGAITAGTPDNELIPATRGGNLITGLFSVFGTATYDYEGKYGAQVSLRNDKSSRFTEANNSATFYAVSGRWNINREDFMKDVNWVDNLKLRASYGSAGNERSIGQTQGIQQLGTGTSYSGTRPLFQGGIANESLTWESTNQLNVGLDFDLFDSRLGGSIDVYNKKTEDLFINFTLPAYFGDTSVQVNGGNLVNKGVELALQYDLVRPDSSNPDGFSMTLNGNIAYNKNEITDLGDQVNQFEQGTSIIRVGEAIGSHYIVEWAGVNPSNGEPLYRDLDGNITNVYSASNNKTGFGQSEPLYTGGFGFDMSYKGFTFSNLWVFSKDFSRFNNQTFFVENPNFYGFNQSTEMLQIWQNPGDITDIQGAAFEREFSSKDIEDASFLRLRNVTLAYNFNENVINKIGFIEGIRIYAQGVNLLTFTEWTGFDPEDNNNIAQFEYPTPRQYTFGIDVNF
ncbi:SusC/RagA family TonB-linked outer membrane protein [Nonlabens ulvanivorans]|uniref:SusC/RagA family TonB-linked outer membrane protein n=1 Tax=Nonlabens ulvanivorans TaxID=906888 RepID=UPI0032630E93